MPDRPKSQRGYKLPDAPFGNPLICCSFLIPDTPEFKAAATAQIQKLAWYWTWEKREDINRLEVTDILRAAIFPSLGYRDSSFCGEGVTGVITDIRINGCNLEVQIDNDPTWIVKGDITDCVVPGPPGETGPPGPPGPIGPPGEDGLDFDCNVGCEPELCRVSWGMLRILLNENFVPYLEAIAADVGVIPTFDFTNYLEVYGLAFLDGGTAAFENWGQYMWNQETAVSGFIDGFITTLLGVYLEVGAKHFYCNMEQNLAFTEISYQNFLNDYAVIAIDEALQGYILTFGSVPLFEIQERISRALYTTPIADCTDFDCDEPWCVHYDFTQEEGRAGWEIGQGEIGSFGYQTVSLGDVLYIRRDSLVPLNITRVRFHFFYDALVNQGEGLWGGFDFTDPIIDSLDADGSTSGYTFDVEYDPGQDVVGVRIVCTVGGDFGDKVYLDWAEFYGFGEPMLGDGFGDCDFIP